MATSKPKLEAAPIEPLPDQKFMLTPDEVMFACAEYVIRNRRDSRYTFARQYAVSAATLSVTITLTDKSVK